MVDAISLTMFLAGFVATGLNVVIRDFSYWLLSAMLVVVLTALLISSSVLLAMALASAFTVISFTTKMKVRR